MADTSTNDTIFDHFLYIIDTAIEQGNPNILQNAIKQYEGKIAITYINMAKSMYEQLIVEKIDDMSI